jgi:hypothetical protein
MRNTVYAVAAMLLSAATIQAQPPALIKKNQAEKGYSIKPAVVKATVWSDRNYAITLLPPSLKDTQVIVRPSGAGFDWLDPRDYTATADCTMYLAVRDDYNGNKLFTNAHAKKLTDVGWIEVDELFRVSAPKDENWKWRIFKRDIVKGKVDIELENFKFEAMTLFLVGKRRE